jgi:antitoxin component of RelBE/YafQ-DinJ toxin-antitoxin module
MPPGRQASDRLGQAVPLDIALATLDAVGLTASDAVRLLFRRIIDDQAFPHELKLPNAETWKATEAAPAVSSHWAAARFADGLRRQRMGAIKDAVAPSSAQPGIPVAPAGLTV